MAQALVVYPRGLGELAKHAGRLYACNLRTIFLIELACFVALVVGMVPPILVLLIGISLAAMFQSILMLLVTLVLVIVAGFAMIVIVSACMNYLLAAATVAVTLNLRGLTADFKQIRRQLDRSMIVQVTFTGMLQVMAILLGYLLLIIPGFIAMAWFAFAVPIVVIERVAYVSALQRSRELAQGQVLRILAAMLCLQLVYMLMIVVGESVLSFIMNAALARPIMSYVIMFLYTPFQWILLVLLYFDTRIRKGEIGLEEIAEPV